MGLLFAGFWLVLGIGAAIICGIIGVIKFVPSLLAYKHTHDRKSFDAMINSICLVLPIIIVGGGALIKKIYSDVSEYNNLYYQANFETVEGMERLLKKGIYPDCKATNLENRPARDGEYTILTNLANYNHHHEDTYEKMKLLIEYGADVNYKACPNCRGEHGNVYCQYSAIMLVCERPGYQAVEIIELLLDNGADINAVSYSGETALDIIEDRIAYCKSRDIEPSDQTKAIRKLLIDNGAKRGKKRK